MGWSSNLEAHVTPLSAKVLSVMFGAFVLSYLVVGPLFRSWRRRARSGRGGALLHAPRRAVGH